MKTGHARIAAVYVFCPYCDEPCYLGDNGSSLIISTQEVRPGQVIECENCGEKYKAPAMLKKLEAA